MKPLNLLAFLLGLSLAFVPLSYADYCTEYSSVRAPGTTFVSGNTIYSAGSTVVYSGGPWCTLPAYVPSSYFSSGQLRFRVENSSHSISDCSNSSYGDNTMGFDVIGYDVVEIGTCETPPAEPSTCSDGLLTEGETGIDCGGECSAECQSFCSSGYTLEYPVDIADGVCISYADPDSVGNCPEGYTSYSEFYGEAGNYDSDCMAFGADPYPMSQAFYEDNFQLNPPDDFIPAPSSFETGAISYSTVSTPETIVDNGDGTETVTITNTTTNNINNTSTSTSVSVNRPSGSASGTGFSSSGGSGVGVASGYSGTSDISGDTAIEENPENYDFSPDFGSDGDFDGSLSAEDLPEKSDLMALYDGMITNIPLFAALDTYQVSTSETQCNMVLGNVWGTSLSIDFCRWESYLIAFGSILLLITQAGAILIVVRGWK